MKEITLNGHKLQLSFNGASKFRFSKEGGNADEIKNLFSGDRESSARGFFNMVTFIWSMLAEESRLKYPTAEDFAMICVPEFSKEFYEELVLFLDEEKKQQLEVASNEGARKDNGEFSGNSVPL